MKTLSLPYRFQYHFYLNQGSSRRRFYILAMALLVTLSSAYVLLTLLSFLYPSGRLLPRSEVANLAIGGLSVEAAESKLVAQELSKRQLRLVINGEEVAPSYHELGIRFDTAKSVQQAYDTQQVSPSLGWAWTRLLRRQSSELAYHLDEAALRNYLETTFATRWKGPVNASLRVDNEQAVIQPEEAGWKLDFNHLRAQIGLAAATQPELTVIQTEQIEPAITAPELTQLQPQVQAILDRTLTLKLNNTTYEIPLATLNSWIIATESSGHLQLQIKSDRVKNYLETLAPQIDKPAVTTRRTISDGIVVEQVNGQTGLSLDTSATAQAIVGAIESSESTVALVVKELAPAVSDTRTYNATNKGLTALLAEFARTHGGTYGIEVRSLDGGIKAGYASTKPFVTASTYKMFLAYAVLLEIQESHLTLSEKTNIGWTVDACLQEMILNSTNPCAVALGTKIGWAKVQQIVRSAGFTQTTLNNYDSNGFITGDKYSSAADEALFLQKLAKGQLLDQSHTERLLHLLRTQHYKSGIPRGVPATVTVANKVGFLEGYKHDVGVIYGPKQTYILAVMSFYGNDPSIAELSGQVYSLLNR